MLIHYCWLKPLACIRAHSFCFAGLLVLTNAKCLVSTIYHYRITLDSLTALKNPLISTCFSLPTSSSLGNHWYLLFPSVALFPRCYIVRITYYVSFSGWLLSLDKMHIPFLSLIPHFLSLNNIPLYVFIATCLSILLLIDVWAVSTPWLLQMAKYICMYLCEYQFLVLLDLFLGVTLLSHKIILFNVLRKYQIIFHSSWAIFTFLPAIQKGSIFFASLSTLENTPFFFFFLWQSF